eukprot:9497964-Pyramimonas_sp.AAC.1
MCAGTAESLASHWASRRMKYGASPTLLAAPQTSLNGGALPERDLPRTGSRVRVPSVALFGRAAALRLVA